jgi:lipoyl(octanoyl) transferase
VSDELPIRDDGAATGADNMRLDTELLEACAAGRMPGLVRFYWFEPPCLSLGRMQPQEDADLEACRRDGVDVVRRPSGGRAVLHDQEVTYAVVCRASDPHFGGRVLLSCERIHAVIAAALAALGVTTAGQCTPRDVRASARELAAVSDCFARPAAHELVDGGGRKLVGSAQARRGGALLQHGSILLDPSRVSGYLRRPAAGPGTAGIRGLLGRQVAREEVVTALRGAFEAAQRTAPAA